MKTETWITVRASLHCELSRAHDHQGELVRQLTRFLEALALANDCGADVNVSVDDVDSSGGGGSVHAYSIPYQVLAPVVGSRVTRFGENLGVRHS